jgi:hypothetical protein
MLAAMGRKGATDLKDPLLIIMFLNLPVIVQYPFLVKNASSPVCSQTMPFSSSIITSAVFSGLFQYPFWTEYPDMQSSPREPSGTVLPSRLTILACR